MIRASLEIARKDLLLRLRDRSALIWGVVAPLGLALIFSSVLGGVADGSSIDVTMSVVDEDGGAISNAFVTRLQGIDASGLFTVEVDESASGAEERAAAGDIDATIIIPPGFGAAVERGDPATIAVVGYVDSPIGSQVAAAVAQSFADEVNGVSAAVATRFAVENATPSDALVASVVEAASAQASPITVDTATENSKELTSSTFYAAAMAVFFLFFTVQFGVMGLLEERSDSTLSRLLAAPIPRASIILGKVLTSFVLGVSSMAVLIITTSLLPFMDAQWGDPLAVGLLVLAGVFSAMGVMTLVAAYARTAETAGSIQAVVAFVLGMLGGAFFPLSQVGGVVAFLSRLTPHSWFLRGLGDLAGGGGMGDVLAPAAFMVAFGLATAAVAAPRLGRAVQP